MLKKSKKPLDKSVSVYTSICVATYLLKDEEIIKVNKIYKLANINDQKE